MACEYLFLTVSAYPVMYDYVVFWHVSSCVDGVSYFAIVNIADIAEALLS